MMWYNGLKHMRAVFEICPWFRNPEGVTSVRAVLRMIIEVGVVEGYDAGKAVYGGAGPSLAPT
jgi:hypothetical protein